VRDWLAAFVVVCRHHHPVRTSCGWRCPSGRAAWSARRTGWRTAGARRSV